MTKGRTPKAEIQTYLDYYTNNTTLKSMKSRQHDGTLEMYYANSRMERSRNLQLLY